MFAVSERMIPLADQLYDIYIEGCARPDLPYDLLTAWRAMAEHASRSHRRWLTSLGHPIHRYRARPLSTAPSQSASSRANKQAHVAIAKHCRSLGVPVPERDYRDKLQVGKPVTKQRTRPKFLSGCTNRSVTNRSVTKKDRYRNQANSTPLGNGTCKR